MSEELKSGTNRKPSGNQWVRRSTCFQTSEVDREKNFTSLSRHLSKVAPHILAPILNVQTSHFVKVLFVINFSQSRDGVSFFWTQGAFSELFCRGVEKQWKRTEKLGILCRCICEGRRTSIHQCRKSSRVADKTWTKRLSVNSRVNLFSDAGSWQIEDRHTSFSKSVITFATSTRAISECADLPLRKTFSCHKFKPIPERCEWFSNARRFFRAFLSRSQKTTKMDWKTWNFVSMYLRRS